MESVVNELGLSKSLPLLGGSTFEYVLEEVWTEGSVEGEILFLDCQSQFLINYQ